MYKEFKIDSVNISEKKGIVKEPVDSIILEESGIKGDAHAGKWHRQISMLAKERVEDLTKESGREFKKGEFAENLTTDGIDLRTVAPLDRFKIGEAELEVTQIGKECHGHGCAIYKRVGKCIMPVEGLFCRVVKGGEVKAGTKAKFIERPLKFSIITSSDRAFEGVYTDRSGPEIAHIIQTHFKDTRWHLEVENTIVPDNPEKLTEAIKSATDKNADIIITTGGTGVGPRDFTPNVVESLCDKMIPGIMEHIRMKYGALNTKALVSRSVAGIIGQSQIYALPGSIKGVQEYMNEILKSIEHLIFMLHQIDKH